MRSLVHHPGPLLLALLAGAPAFGSAQLISPKTIPVATGEQFLIYPAARLGMGGLSLAVDDPLLDPFVNPAKGARLQGVQIFGSPTLYRVSEGNGDGKTLPAGALLGGERWFGGASVALQQLDGSAQRWPVGRVVFDSWAAPSERLSDRTATNLYLFGGLGRRLADGRTSLAGSVSYAALDAVDGVDLLYARSQRIEQDGHMADFRLGLLRELEGDRSLELLLLHNRFDMTHDVTYQEWRWDPALRRSVGWSREERNQDRTHTWGAHLGYRLPLGGHGWRLGTAATMNYKTHPKIPNYEIMNIPRDPGHSWAYNLGLGLAKTDGPTTVGVEAIYEPIWSDTWAEADTAMTGAGGVRIPVGGKTVENEFLFSNALLRFGLDRQEERLGFQLGLQVRAIRYWLEQYDNVRGRRRGQQESWAEWTPTWGLGMRFPEVQVRYSGRITTGTGRPGIDWVGFRTADAVALGSTYIVAPAGALTLQEAVVTAHQVMVTLPVH